MPTYDYKCKDCQNQFEVFQSIHDDALTTCPDCKGQIVRLISRNVGISFKGSGFYITDTRNTDTPAPSASPAPVASDPVTSSS